MRIRDLVSPNSPAHDSRRRGAFWTFSDRGQIVPQAPVERGPQTSSVRGSRPRTSNRLPSVSLWSGNLSRRSGCVGIPSRRRAPNLLGLMGLMASRIRHCVECPKCLTRYLVGFSPYRNGSYLVSLTQGLWEEWVLYCACRMPPASSRWTWKELKVYEVSNQAHHSGYGPPEEIVEIRRRSHYLT
jgi:hypothetical protein